MRPLACGEGLTLCHLYTMSRRITACTLVLATACAPLRLAVADSGASSVPSTSCAETDDRVPYACVPFATAVVLAYFDKSHSYGQIAGAMRVNEHGETPIADLLKVVENNGLFCAAYQNLTVSQVMAYLRSGFAGVLIGRMRAKQHAAAMLMKGSDLYVADFLSPPHKASLDRLQTLLKSGGICVFVGTRPVPDPGKTHRIICYGGAAGCAIVALLLIRTLGVARRRRQGPPGGLVQNAPDR